MEDRQLILHHVNIDPPSYRVIYDGVEVGSISERLNHVTNRIQWSWGVDTMPLIGGGSEPTGEALTKDDAIAAFKPEFFRWLDSLHPGDWQRNRDYKKANKTKGNYILDSR